MSISDKQLAFVLIGLASGLGALSPPCGYFVAFIFLTTAVLWWAVE